MDWKLGGLTLLLVCSSATAQARQDAADHEAMLSACRSVGELAETIMRKRQDGFPMAELMDRASNPNKDMQALSEQFVISAYDQPRMSVPENQETAIADFQNDAYLACIKAKTQ